jgi:mono/diheme cytochrome c family protein
MNGKLKRGLRRLALLSAVPMIGACSWFTDFKEQPKFDPWESTSDKVPARGNPQGSVSIYGSAAPGYAVSHTPSFAAIDSMKGIPNPVPADARSLQNGRLYYQINCAVCHGEAGKGDGPILAAKAIFPPALAAGAAATMSDGSIWGIIRNGRGAMPSYDRIEELDRWDVVNYIRGLQGRYQVAVGPAGLPGETGDKVPGYSQMGPTRPSPYYHHAGSQAGPTLFTPPSAATTSPPAAAPVSPAAPAATPDSTRTPTPGGER